MAAQMFFAGLLSAIAVKLTSSIDDVLWLAPFLTTNVSYKVRCQNAMVYLGVCMLQTVVAMVIACSGTEAVEWLTGDSKNAWSTDKILTVSAGVLLALYTVKLVLCPDEDDEDGAEEAKGKQESEGSENNESASDERINDSEESTVASEMELGLIAKDKLLLDKEGFPEGSDQSAPAAPPKQQVDVLQVVDETRSSQAGSYSALAVGEEKQSCDERTSSENDAVRRQESTDKKRQETLFMIAFIGSIDDLTLFVPMLVGKGFDWLQLMSGAFIAGATIVMICLFIGLCKPVADVLSKIPLAFIVGTFSTVLLTKAFFIQ